MALSTAEPKVALGGPETNGISRQKISLGDFRCVCIYIYIYMCMAYVYLYICVIYIYIHTRDIYLYIYICIMYVLDYTLYTVVTEYRHDINHI